MTGDRLADIAIAWLFLSAICAPFIGAILRSRSTDVLDYLAGVAPSSDNERSELHPLPCGSDPSSTNTTGRPE